MKCMSRKDFHRRFEVWLNTDTMSFLIFCIMMSFARCDRRSTIQFPVPFERMIVTIESVSPNGEYAFINIYNRSDTLNYWLSPTQMVLDIKKANCWALLDTAVASDANHFVWSEDSKRALFSAANRHPVDTSDLIPIYLYDLQSKGIAKLKKPWLRATYHSIALFFPKRPKIIFWSPTAVADTSHLSFISIGGLYIWDTLQDSVVEIKKGYEISDVFWMQLYDTTLIYIDINHVLWSICVSTGDMKRVLPDVRGVSEIRRFQNKIVFGGKNDKGDRIFVYNLDKKSPEIALDYPKVPILSAAINKNNKLAIETVDGNSDWIFIISGTGIIVDSLKGHSPFWLAGTDSLIYSRGKKISLAYWREGELKKWTILEVVR